MRSLSTTKKEGNFLPRHPQLPGIITEEKRRNRFRGFKKYCGRGYGVG